MTINVLLTEAANATVITSSQMWISDDVYSPYIDVAVYFYVFKLFAAPLLGPGCDHEIHNVTKMLLRKEDCDLLGFYAAQKSQKSAYLIYIAQDD